MKFATPGSADRHVSAVRHVTICAARPSISRNEQAHEILGLMAYRSRGDSDQLGHMLSLAKPSLLVDTLTLYSMITPFDAFEILCI